MKNSEYLDQAVSHWGNVTLHPHRFGGTEYRLGTHELGHRHGEHLVDVPFPVAGIIWFDTQPVIFRSIWHARSKMMPAYRAIGEGANCCKRVRDDLVASGAAQAHHVLPESGWVSDYLREPEDVARAVALLRRSYELASAQAERRAARQREGSA